MFFYSILYRRTVALIFVSWAAAPLITGIFGALFFWFIRRFVLRSSEPYKRSVKIYPVTIFLAVGLDLFMVLYKAGKNNPQIKEWGLKFQLPVAFGISGVLAMIFYFFLNPCLERRIAAKFDKEKEDLEKAAGQGGEKGDGHVPPSLVMFNGDVDGDILKKENEGEETSIEKPVTVSSILKEAGEEDSDSVEDEGVTKSDGLKKSEKSMTISERMSSSVHKSMKKLGDVSVHILHHSDIVHLMMTMLIYHVCVYSSMYCVSSCIRQPSIVILRLKVGASILYIHNMSMVQPNIACSPCPSPVYLICHSVCN